MASKKSGSKAKSVGGAKRGKSEAKSTLKDLDVKKSKGVRGGMVVKINDVLITGVTGGATIDLLQHEGLHATK
jgi:hypothetical protein